MQAEPTTIRTGMCSGYVSIVQRARRRVRQLRPSSVAPDPSHTAISAHLRVRRQAMLRLAAVDEDTQWLAWRLPVRALVFDDLHRIKINRRQGREKCALMCDQCTGGRKSHGMVMPPCCMHRHIVEPPCHHAPMWLLTWQPRWATYRSPWLSKHTAVGRDSRFPAVNLTILPVNCPAGPSTQPRGMHKHVSGCRLTPATRGRSRRMARRHVGTKQQLLRPWIASARQE